MYYIIYQGSKKGPLSVEQLKTLVSRGKIDGKTSVSLDTETWTPLGEVAACVHLLAFVPALVPEPELRLPREPRPKPKPRQPRSVTESQSQPVTLPQPASPPLPTPTPPPLTPSMVAVPHVAVTSDVKIVTELPPQARRPARWAGYWTRKIAIRALLIPVIGIVSYAIVIFIDQRIPESDKAGYDPHRIAVALKDRFSQTEPPSRLGNNVNEEVRFAEQMRIAAEARAEAERQARIAAEARANAAEARLAAANEKFEYRRVGNAITITRLKDLNMAGTLVIPATIEGCLVTSIGTFAFAHCSRLTSLTIPPSVTSIGDMAFAGCENLTIYGKRGSEAEKYVARERGTLRFVAQ